MIRAKILFVFIISVIIFSSCGGDPVEMGNPKKTNFKGFENNIAVIQTYIPIKNNRPHKITIKNIELNVHADNSYLGTISVNNPIVLKPKSDSLYIINMDIEIKNSMLGVKLYYKYMQGKNVNTKIDGFARIKMLGVSKKIRVKYDMPVNLKSAY